LAVPRAMGPCDHTEPIQNESYRSMNEGWECVVASPSTEIRNHTTNLLPVVLGEPPSRLKTSHNSKDAPGAIKI